MPGAVHELSQGPLDAEQRASRAGIEQRRGEFAALDPPHVQLQQTRVVRRRSDGKAAPPAAGQHDVDVLARLEIEDLRRRQPQVQSHHIVRQGHGALDARRQSLDESLLGRGDFEGFDGHIAARARLAHEHEALGRLGFGQSQRRAVGVVDLALQQAGAAGAAIAALAAMRQVQRGLERRIEQRLIRRGAEAQVGLEIS